MRILLRPAFEYFAIVFGAGFVFGTVRVLWLVPAVGVRTAELAELPLMLIVVALAARLITRRRLTALDQRSHLVVGGLALAFLLLAELALGVLVFGATPSAVLAGRDPVSAVGSYACLGIFAAMPWAQRFLGRPTW